MSLAGLAIVFFLAIAMLTEDIHRRTICMILSRPISRVQYVVGKFIGLAATILLAVIIVAVLALAAGWLGTQFIPDMKPPRNFSWGMLMLGVGFNYLSLLVLMAVGFLATVVTTSAYLSMLITFCFYIIGHTLETIVKVVLSGEFIQVGAAYTQLLNSLTWLFPNLSAFDIKVYISYGLPYGPQLGIGTALYGIAYIAVCVGLTVLLFQRKEIK
jgi:ABC-type transport system involved in multi-copper enzyme maturation permease subunit